MKNKMFFLVLSGVLGYLIMKKLDESDMYITKRPQKSRHTHREIEGVTNVFLKGDWTLHKEEKTDLGIPVNYWEDGNGNIVRTYGKDKHIVGKK